MTPLLQKLLKILLHSHGNQIINEIKEMTYFLEYIFKHQKRNTYMMYCKLKCMKQMVQFYDILKYHFFQTTFVYEFQTLDYHLNLRPSFAHIRQFM